MHISIKAEELFHIFGFPITNSLLVTWAVIVALVFVSYFVTRRLTRIPGKAQNIVETFFELLLGLFDGVTGDRELTKKIFPLVATIFISVLAVNWSGLLPGVGTIGINEVAHEGTKLVPFLRAPSADLNFTLGLSLISVIMIQVWGIGALGIGKYSKKFISFKNPLTFFIGILELISEFSKVISFSFRLFGNIFAGEVLLTVILSLTYYIVPVPFLMLELFVGLIQALVFSLLTAVFVTLARQEAHG